MNKFISISLVSTALCISACSSEKKSSVSGDDYVGVWVNPQGKKSQSEKDVVVNDRVIVEKTEKENIYATTILAKGVFTKMTFNPENGLLCASNNACFQFQDGKLRLGSQQGVLTYERENSNEIK